MRDDEDAGAFVIDFVPAVEYLDALNRLGSAWARRTPGERAQLARLVWLDPAGTCRPYTELGADLDPIRELDELARCWADVSPLARPGLSRLIWLHPDGEVIVYRAPVGDLDEEP